MGNETSALDAESDQNHTHDGFTSTDFQDSMNATTPWIPWLTMRRHIIVDATCFVTCLLCWMLSEIKSVGLVCLIFRMKALMTIAFLAIRAGRHYLEYRTKESIFSFFQNTGMINFLRVKLGYFAEHLNKKMQVMGAMAHLSTNLLFKKSGNCQ